MFWPHLYRLTDQKYAPAVLPLVHSFGPMKLEHCEARPVEIGCVSFGGFFVSTRSINLRSMKVFSSSLKTFRDSSGVKT